MFPHRCLDWGQRHVAAGGANVEKHFRTFRSVARLMENDMGYYQEDWVRVFYVTLWVSEDCS